MQKEYEMKNYGQRPFALDRPDVWYKLHSDIKLTPFCQSFKAKFKTAQLTRFNESWFYAFVPPFPFEHSMNVQILN